MSTIPRQLGKYQLQQQLGRGSVGETWKAHDPQANVDVAITILHTDLQSDPNFMTRFLKEGQMIAGLQHSNIVQVREVKVQRSEQGNETIAYIVSDYIEGQTLADYIQANSHQGRVPHPVQLVYLFSSLGVAIDYAHQQGVIHGNIKPSNILLDKYNTSHFEGGEPMLTDFVLPLLSGSGESVGTPHYMSPEQAKGLPPNNRSDIYALGVILYELCTGVKPFRDESSVAVMMQHINTLPTPPILINPNVPATLSEAILRAMAKDTATRFSMASLLATALADACSMQPTYQATRVESSESDDAAYQQKKDASPPILGVSQPILKTPQRPNTLPLSLRSISGSLPAVSGNYPAIRRTPLPAASERNPTSLTGAHERNPMSMPGANERNPTSLTGANERISMSMPTVKTPSLPSASFPPPPGPSSPGNRALIPISNPQPPQRTIMPPPSFRASSTKGRGWIADIPVYIVVTTLLLLLLVIGSAIGMNLMLHNQQGNADNAPGHVFFQDDALGHSDQLRIELRNVPAPEDGKGYYAWLQGTDNNLLQLGQLPLSNGNITYTYTGDSKHSNLLAYAEQFLITKEISGSNPDQPSNDKVYQALPDNAAYPYIKNILYSTPDLPGDESVIAAIFETIKSLNDKAGSIVDTLQGKRDYDLVGRQATRIMEAIDGTAYAVSSQDLPKRYPPQSNTKIGLLSSPEQTGYLDILEDQLTGLKSSAGDNKDLLQRVQNVENALTNLRDWIQKIHDYDVQILKASALTDPAIIGVALQLKKAAADSYTGRTIPPNPAPLPTLGSAGAYQAYTEAQYMATLNIQRI